VLPERGDLAERSLARLLLELHQARFEGALALSRDNVEKSFLFQEGVPVHAESNRTSESLGIQLMDAGRITRTDYGRVVDMVKKKQCKEGNALLALRLIEPKDLFLALKEQVRLRLVDCFSWPRGSFELDPSAEVPEGVHPLRADVHALVQEGIEAHWSPDRVLSDLGDDMGRHPVPTRNMARVSLHLRRDDAVDKLLESLDGERTLWQTLQEAQSPRALAAVWVLAASGALELRDDPVSRDPQGEAQPPEVEIVVGSASRQRKTRRAAAAERKPVDAEAAAALARAIEERFARLAESDAYDILGVPRDADDAAIKRAYLTAAKAYHPDVIARSGLDTDTRVRANKLFAEMAKAHSILSDPARRRDYDLTLEGGGDELDAERLANAEGLYRKGEILLRQGNFRGAIEFLLPAVELWPEEPAYQCAAGWALYKKLPSEPERAREHLERAAELNPKDGVALFRLSVVMRALGEDDASADLLARAKQIDPQV
jgi:curved DNA-binding protein CbpA